jgi:hypothetical protein
MKVSLGRRGVLAIVVVSMLFLAGGIAYAMIPDGNKVFSACMLKNVGTIRLIDPSLPGNSLITHCTALEAPLTWNQVGQPGPPGQQGTQGPQGPQGPQGAQGLPGAAGTSQAYFAQNSHVVETSDDVHPQQVVGLSGLPAGKYLFWTTIANNVYVSGGKGYYDDIYCTIKVNGQDVASSGVHMQYSPTSTDVVALTVPANTSFIVDCYLFDEGPLSDGKTLAWGRVTALPVGAIN